MRITRRQLTQIIREELVREATKYVSKIETVSSVQQALNDTLASEAGFVPLALDNQWAGKTEAAWDMFVDKFYISGAGQPAKEQVKNSWRDVAKDFGTDLNDVPLFTGDPDGALKFINQYAGNSSAESFEQSDTVAPLDTSSSVSPGPTDTKLKAPPNTALAASTTTQAQQPSETPSDRAKDAINSLRSRFTGEVGGLEADAGEKYHISLLDDAVIKWSYVYDFVQANLDPIEVLDSSNDKYKNQVYSLGGGRTDKSTIMWNKIENNNFISFDEETDANSAFNSAKDVYEPQLTSESIIRRWSRLAGLLVD